MVDAVTNEAHAVMAKGSKSFYLASRFFPTDLMNGASLIYFWCRHCDDVLDDGKDGSSLEELKTLTDKIWNSAYEVLPVPFEALRKAANKFQIPSFYAMELLEGMAMDERNERYETISELKLYCYRVASTVGLMMSHVMGLYDKRALKEAAHLGLAMQMTNIARDVQEDHERGRLYLPLEWLQQVGLTKENYMRSENRSKLFLVVKRLLAEAEKYYNSGLAGIEHLPLRSAYTILIAAYFYREIGRNILRQGESALSTRAYVSKGRKIVLILKGTFDILRLLPERMFKRRELDYIDIIWRLK
ncbi:phytoene/squalene synthase family protein [Peredibacter starrii]|uniref:Phytoene/squalene synthase family protein n=1 Tax=Peredibacter starrii TaxID=28202 RepID=A0AAX4HPQ7_9BACT|nr:phytoene/squalene synthase family protein [Peredibacter starrii]WPU65130.1 phytoene/squalene synthase family protein [Peredibacter starrii]